MAPVVLTPRRRFHRRKSKRPQGRAFSLDPLEPRVLLSSDFGPFAIDMANAGNDLTLRLADLL